MVQQDLEEVLISPVYVCLTWERDTVWDVLYSLLMLWYCLHTGDFVISLLDAWGNPPTSTTKEKGKSDGYK